MLNISLNQVKKYFYPDVSFTIMGEGEESFKYYKRQICIADKTIFTATIIFLILVLENSTNLKWD